jgi:serine/threonine protein kinase
VSDVIVNTQSPLATSIDGYNLESLLGDGTFSWVYKAIRDDEAVVSNRRGDACIADSQLTAVKIAKPSGYIVHPALEQWTASQCLRFTTGGVMGAIPDAEQLLAFQSLKIQAAADGALPAIHKFVMTDDNCYCRMELITGRSLRQAMSERDVPLKSMAELLMVMQRLSENPQFGYHGDLKPENVFLTEAGIRIIDPGYFGPLDCLDGTADACVVTTPAYYPMLKADDLLAIGIMLWEVICGVHPLVNVGSEMTAGETVVNLVRQKEHVGQYFLTPLLRIQPPSAGQASPYWSAGARPGTASNGLAVGLEQFLLKALRLKITAQDKFELDEGFDTFASMAQALRELVS